jgi:hypothetical protein
MIDLALAVVGVVMVAVHVEAADKTGVRHHLRLQEVHHRQPVQS